MLTILLPLALFMALHYFVVGKIVKRKNLRMAMLTMLLAIAITTYAYYENGGRFTKDNIMLIFPTTYLIGAITFRYLIFQSYLKRFFPLKKPPFDPEIVYTSDSGLIWDKKNYEVCALELIYSHVIFIFPFLCVLIIASIQESQDGSFII